MADQNQPHPNRRNAPEYTEFGIKIHKLRLTLKVQKRSSSTEVNRGHHERGRLGSTESEGQSRRRRPRANSSSSSVSDSLRMLDLDSNAGSRRPVVQDASRVSGTRLANWEFEGFYSPPVRTSTPSSGYSSAAVSRTSSFSSEYFNNNPTSANNSRHFAPRQRRLTSADDSAYSEVYSTIEELSELPDPFDDDEEMDKFATVKAKHHPLAKKILESKRPEMKCPESKCPSMMRRPEDQCSKAKSLSSLLQETIQCGTGVIISHQKTKSTTSLMENSPFNRGQPPVVISHQKTKSTASLLDNQNHSVFAPVVTSHHKTKSSSSILEDGRYFPQKRKTKSNTSLDLPDDIPPPLLPRSSKCRPPARPPYPSSMVLARR